MVNRHKRINFFVQRDNYSTRCYRSIRNWNQKPKETLRGTEALPTAEPASCKDSLKFSKMCTMHKWRHACSLAETQPTNNKDTRFRCVAMVSQNSSLILIKHDCVNNIG